MAAPSADVVFWGFVWWLRHNRFQDVETLTERDIIAAATLFAAENSDALSAADPGTYTDLEWPGTITATQTQETCDQSTYPQTPK